MTDITKILDLTAEQIGNLTRKAFQDMLKRISDGQDPRDAISAVMQGFDPDYRDTLAASFTKALGDFVGAEELASYPVGEVSLSQALYQHARETSAAVRQIVFEHQSGWQGARKLAMDIYEGYGFKGGDDPLQWPKYSDKWPKYMQRAVVTDPASYRGWLNVARQGVSGIKTPALKAAYSELLDAVEKGAGEKALSRRLDVAFQEQMRFRANRIAQTELHRQWMDKQAAEIMGDETISVVQVRMADSHPKIDICDLFAQQDAYGLGPGLYPKEEAPKPPFHPFCRCRWVSKRLLSADQAKFDPEAGRKYLHAISRSVGPKAAARVIGSKDKLLRVLNRRTTVEEVFNQHRPAPYRLGKLGDVELKKVPAQAAATAAGEPMAAVATTKIERLDDFIAAGRKITAELPADGIAAFDHIIERLRAEVGTSAVAKVVERGKGAALVQHASARFPDAWTQAVDQLGPLHVRGIGQNGRGSHSTWTMDGVRRQGGRLVRVTRGEGFIDTRDDIGCAVHEYTHRLQAGLPSLDQLFHDLHAQRTAGDPLERLRDVTRIGYSYAEVTRKDKYIDPYFGKEYGNRGPLEMMTMTMQMILSVRNQKGFVVPKGLAEFERLRYTDPEMFDLGIGLLFNWKP